MQEFIAQYASLVAGVLTGFDRLVFRGYLLPLMRGGGMYFFLQSAGIRLLDFREFAKDTTEQLKQRLLDKTLELGRPVQYLDSPKIDKEQLARQLLEESPVEQGLICTLKAVEPCRTFEYHRSQDPKQRGLRLVPSKCLHLYQYHLHPRFGFMHARIQTWFPFNIQICLNGREWLATQLVSKGHDDFLRADNCFPRLGDIKLAQRLMDRQLTTKWPSALDAIARSLNPLHRTIFRSSPMSYHWSAYQTEWATDIMFHDPASLANVYPSFVRRAVHDFKSRDVMRFLADKSPGNFTGQIVSSFKDRAEGVRVKHWVGGNSIKMYDKAGSILRIETTIGNPADFKVFRPRNDQADGELKWQPMRKGVADLHRRAEVSQRSNDTYLDALSVTNDTTPCSELFDAVSRRVTYHGYRLRALRLNDPRDVELLEAICHGEFATAGFRNRDLRRLLHPASDDASADDQRRLSAATSRQLRLLRAHGLIRKLPKSHRYRLTERGHKLTAALSATRHADIKTLSDMAA